MSLDPQHAHEKMYAGGGSGARRMAGPDGKPFQPI